MKNQITIMQVRQAMEIFQGVVRIMNQDEFIELMEMLGKTLERYEKEMEEK